MNKLRIGGLLAPVLTGFLLCAPAVMAYEAGTVDNGGSITGKIIFTGSSVPTRTVVPTKNKNVCGGPRQDPLVDIGMDNGVKNAVVVIRDMKKGKQWDETAGPAELDNDKCVFHPHVQVVREGADFIIRNSDPFLHNTHIFYGNKTAFNVALPFPGAKVTRKLVETGLIRVDCDVHGWMQAWVYVVDNPYYAMTGEDGTFTITDVPAGDYTLLIWQEHGGEMEKQVTVAAGGSADIGTVEIK